MNPPSHWIFKDTSKSHTIIVINEIIVMTIYQWAINGLWSNFHSSLKDVTFSIFLSLTNKTVLCYSNLACCLPELQT